MGIRPFYSAGSPGRVRISGPGVPDLVDRGAPARRPPGGPAHRTDVGEAREQQHERDQEDAPSPVARKDDGEDSADDPEQLEARLEPREGPAPGDVGAVSLQQAVEREPAARRGGGDGGRGDDQRAASVRPRREHERHARYDQRTGEDPFLAGAAPEDRRHDRADPGADRAQQEHDAEHPRRFLRRLEHERGEEREEADRRAQQTHRGAGGEDAPRAQRVTLVGGLRRADVFGARIPSAASIPSTKMSVAVRSTHGAPASCRIPAAIGPGRDPAEDADEREPRVREHELALVLDDPGTSALLVTDCAFEKHERAERERVQGEAVDVRGHDEAQHRAARHRRREQQASPPARAVDHRTEHRRDEGERGQREHEVQQDLRARLAGRGAEEQRVGERHRDEHVTGDTDRVREGEPRKRRERRRLEPGP